MRSYSRRVTRLVKSYAPTKNMLTYLLGIDKVQQNPLMVYCNVKKTYLPADEFYVKKYRQEADPRHLSAEDFRHVCKEVWDQRVRNQEQGLGWKTDEELLHFPSTLVQFIDGDK